MSLDKLLRQNPDLQSQFESDNETKKNLKPVDTQPYQNKDEGLLLIILVIISAIIPPIGLFMPGYTIWRNTKYNSLYKTIILVSILVIILSILNCYVIINDNWIQPSQTTVYKIN